MKNTRQSPTLYVYARRGAGFLLMDAKPMRARDVSYRRIEGLRMHLDGEIARLKDRLDTDTLVRWTGRGPCMTDINKGGYSASVRK